MKRPALTSSLSPQEFRAWYWLKEELVLFCRAQRLSTIGLKREIETRIEDHLSRLQTGKTPSPGLPQPRRTGIMPSRFTLDTVIGAGWRCGPSLGAFFRKTLGTGFHFNAEMRDFIHNGAGRTLDEAAACYLHSVRPGRKKSQIPEQLEYNRHFREYFEQNPGATRDGAIAAWWVKRRARRES